MLDSELNPAISPAMPWWQHSVWWTAAVVLLVLGSGSGPSAWVVAGGKDGIWKSLGYCGLGFALAQLFLVALVLGCSTDSWIRRLTWAYPLFLIPCAMWLGGWYWGVLRNTAVGENKVRHYLGGLFLFATEAFLVTLIVVTLLAVHYQAQFVHSTCNRAQQSRLRWSLRDMLLWTTWLAATFGVLRLTPIPLDGETLCFSGCICIVAWMVAFLTAGTVLECFAHFPPSESAWKFKYNLRLVVLLAALTALDASGYLFDFESAACRIAIALVAYCTGIAWSITTLERCGWRLVAWAGKRNTAAAHAHTSSNFKPGGR